MEKGVSATRGPDEYDDDDGDQATGGPDGAAAELRAHLGLAWAVGDDIEIFSNKFR